MSNGIDINGKTIIGDECDPYLIAEIGTNHNQDINIARDLIKAVAEAGFDCAKFQTYEPDEIVSGIVRASDYGLDKYYGDISASEMFDKHLKTPKEWFPELIELCKQFDIDCATTIHGAHGLSWARNMNFDLIKVASMDHNNLPFLRSLVDSINAPILISFGMADLPDVDAAVETLRSHRFGVGLFHCVSVYPPRSEELRLANIPFFKKRFAVPVGFSDHADDVTTSLAALSLGSSMFEKHVTLDKNAHGPDHPFALEPEEMKSYVNGIRILAKGLASGDYQIPKRSEAKIRHAYLKSVVTACDIPAGSKLTALDLVLLRPGTGIPPKDIEKVIGCTTIRALNKGSVLTWDDLVF